MIKTNRHSLNPLISPSDLKASRPDFKVDGVFNCGVTEYNDEIILLCRVAESPLNASDRIVKVPIISKDENNNDFIDVLEIDKSKYPNLDFSDSRSINKINHIGKKVAVCLTSISHFRIARSKDGVNFKIADEPTVIPRFKDENWGIEDPRISKIDDTYYINYTSVTANGAATSLITTKDFKSFTREGIIFAPENKDVAIFPEKINGTYYAFNRPVPEGIGTPDIWLAESKDLIHWGRQKHFYGVSETGWESGRVGAGSVPFKTEKGWILIYHAADRNSRYCLGAFLLDKEDPMKIIAKTKEPIFTPETDYEKEGFFGNVVFTCGSLYKDEKVIIYYGAADDKVCRVDIPITEIYKALGV